MTLAASLALAVAWLGALGAAAVAWTALERRARIAPPSGRSEVPPSRAVWGGGLVHPPSRSLLARALAGAARVVRSRSRIRERAEGLRLAARAVGCTALASALALVPFAGRLGGTTDGAPLVVVDVPHGLVAVVLLVVLAALAQVAAGVVEANPFARLAGVRLAGRVLVLAGSFAVVVAPLALAAGSLRLHAIVLDQAERFAPFAAASVSAAKLAALSPVGQDSALAAAVGDAARGAGSPLVEGVVFPAWNVFRQPLSALLFLVVAGLLCRRPLAFDPVGGGVRVSAFGHDDDPRALYWARSEARLAEVLFAALFVALFLGAGAIPFVPAARLAAPLVPFFGEGLPALVAAALELAVFAAKLLFVLLIAGRVARRLTAPRDDQWIRIVTRRLLPLAWANLLLVAGLVLLAEAARTGAQ